MVYLLAGSGVTVGVLGRFSPGIGFGPEGEGWVRLALIENRQRLLQATRNIKRAFTKWRSESQLSAK